MMYVRARVEIQGANAMAGALAMGYPAISAFAGFSHAIRRNLDPEGLLTVASFSILHHSSRLRAHGTYRDRFTHKRNTYDAPGLPRANDYQNSSIDIQPQVDLEATIVVGIDGAHGDLDKARVRFVSGAALPVRGLGGRVIAKPPVLHKTAVDALENAGAGWLVVDRTSQLDGDDPLSKLMDLCSRPTRNKNGTSEPVERHYAPTCIGYVGIGPIARRIGQRDPDVDHAYAEPSLSVVEFVRKNVAIKENDAFTWRPILDRRNRIFILRAGA